MWGLQDKNKNRDYKGGRSMKVGIALGSGGAKGLSHIGVLKVLEGFGIKPEFISGTSIGAIIGGMYAYGIPIGEIEKIALSIDKKQQKEVLSLKPTLSGLISQEKIFNFYYKIFGKTKIEELSKKFVCIATDIQTGEEVSLNKGELAKAVVSSASIPIIFPPVKYKNKYLVDGGLVNPVPIKQLIGMGADFIIAVDVTKPLKKKNIVKEKVKSEEKNILSKISAVFSSMYDKGFNESPNLLNIFLNSIDIMEEQIVRNTLSLYPPDILINPDIKEFGTFDFFKAKEIIDKGEEITKTVADFIKYKLSH